MSKKAGMMEIVLSIGDVTLNPNDGTLLLGDIEKCIGKDRREIFGKYLSAAEELLFHEYVGWDLITIFQKELEITDDDIEYIRRVMSFGNQISFFGEALNRVFSKNENNANNRCEENKGYVYFIKSGDSVKIGKSKNPKDRVKQLQTGSSEVLTMVGFIETNDMVVSEEYLHNKFKCLRKHGEWFALNGEKDSAEYQQKRSEVLKELSMLIKKGYIKTYSELKEYFTKVDN